MVKSASFQGLPLSEIADNKMTLPEQYTSPSSKQRSHIPRRTVSNGGSTTRKVSDSRKSMLPVPSAARVARPSTSERVRSKSPVYGIDNTPEEYIEILQAYVDQDLILEKQQATDLMQKTNVLLAQIQDLNAEKGQLIREKKKLLNLLEDLKHNFENLDKTLIIKNKKIDNEINRHRNVIQLKKKELDEIFNSKLNEVEGDFRHLLESSLNDELEDKRREKELQDLSLKVEEAQASVLKQTQDNASKLKRLASQLAENAENKRRQLDETNAPLRDQRCKLMTDKEGLIIESKKLIKKLETVAETLEKQNMSLKKFESYEGSLQDQILELKSKRIRLIDEIETKSIELENYRTSSYTKEHNEYQELQKRLRVELYTRLKIEDEVLELRKIPRIFAGENFVVPEKLEGIVLNKTNVSDRLNVFLEGSLSGISYCVVNVNGNICIDEMCEYLKTQTLVEKFKSWSFDVKVEEMTSIMETKGLGLVPCYGISVKGVNKVTGKRKAAIVVFLQPNSSELSLIYGLGKSVKTVIVVDGCENTNEDELLKLLEEVSRSNTSKADAYGFMNGDS